MHNRRPAFEDIQTNSTIGERGLVNIYLPQEEGVFPFVLGIHGGGWVGGDRSSYDHFWPRIRTLGIGLVLCSYRGAHEACYPAAYNDIVHLFKWLKKEGLNYRLNSCRCVLLGGSAGGHLSVLSGLRATREESGICAIKGIVDYCGIMDLTEQYGFDRARGSTMTLDFIGGTLQEKIEAYEEASPVNHIHPKAPQIWMAHGTDDSFVPVSQSRKMNLLLRRAGQSPVFLEAEGRNHTMVVDDRMPLEKVEFLFEKEMFEFLKNCLDL